MSVTVTWSPPTEPNGLLANHTLQLLTAADEIVSMLSTDGGATMATFNVTVMAYTVYSVSVRVTGESGGSNVETSNPVRSPEAGMLY